VASPTASRRLWPGSIRPEDPDAAQDILRDIFDLRAKRPSGPTSAMNNLLKRLRGVAFGFTNFEYFRIRAPPYTGRPNFTVLDFIVVA
jgi:hypothetical protein